MDIVKISLIAVVLGIVIVYLRNVNKELATLALVCAVGMLLMVVIDSLDNVFSIYEKLSNISGISNALVRIIIKITLICYIIEFSIGLLEDFGLKSMADKLCLIGKIVVLIIASPIIENLIEIITSIAS